MPFSFKDRGRPVVDEKLCTGCERCVKNCPDDVLTLENKKAKPGEGLFLGCIACGQCVAICPAGAIAVEGRGMRLDDRRPQPTANRATAEALESLFYARRSIRRFADREVEREKIDRILRMTAAAPMGIPPSDVGVVVFHGRDKVARFSAEMCQSFKQMAKKLNPFILGLMRLRMKKQEYEMMRDFVVPLLKMLSQKHEEGEDKFTYGAPAALLFHHGSTADAADVHIAETYAMLAAESLGLGSCLLGTAFALNFDKELSKKYGIPAENKTALAMCFGYPAVKYHHAVERRLASVKFM
jgi:ferredoxin